MLWTSWAMLPFCKARDCKGKHYFLFCKFFDKFFKSLVIFFKKLDRIVCLSSAWLSPHLCSLLPALCVPRTLAPEQGLEPRTPWLTVMCSNQLSYSGIVKEPLSFDCGAKVDIIFYSANFFAKKMQKNNTHKPHTHPLSRITHCISTDIIHNIDIFTNTPST